VSGPSDGSFAAMADEAARLADALGRRLTRPEVLDHLGSAASELAAAVRAVAEGDEHESADAQAGADGESDPESDPGSGPGESDADEGDAGERACAGADGPARVRPHVEHIDVRERMPGTGGGPWA